MKAFKEFQREDKAFWFFVRFISERLGYTDRIARTVNVFTFKQIDELCNKENIDVSVERINKAVLYSEMRADIINNYSTFPQAFLSENPCYIKQNRVKEEEKSKS